MNSTASTIEITGQSSWRRIAWNGVRFSVPADWEIGRIGLRYLMFEVETGPVMEVKWNRVKGRFSHRAHLRRLAGLQTRHLKKSFHQAKLPASWEQALDRYDVSGFSWHSESISGQGVLIYNPASRLATLIQFYRQAVGGGKSAAPRLLASFREPVSEELVCWEVFDIQASIPVEFELQRFRFEAGRYELNFSSKRQQLRMVRFSPAAIWLGRQDLAALAASSFLPKARQAPPWLHGNAAVVQGQVAPTSAAARIASRIRRRPAYRMIRLWHEMEKNRILGVQISGKSPVDHRQFSTICEKYETV